MIPWALGLDVGAISPAENLFWGIAFLITCGVIGLVLLAARTRQIKDLDLDQQRQKMRQELKDVGLFLGPLAFVSFALGYILIVLVAVGFIAVVVFLLLKEALPGIKVAFSKPPLPATVPPVGQVSATPEIAPEPIVKTTTAAETAAPSLAETTETQV